MAWPEMPGCLLRLRYAQVSADSADLDELPDWSPLAGQKGTLKPSIRELVVYDPQGAKIVVELDTVQVEVDADGWLCKRTGEGVLIPLRVAPTDDPLMTSQGWTYTLTLGARSIGPFSAPSSGVVELADYVTAPATDATKAWIERIPELVELLSGATVDPEAIATAVADYLAANPPASAPDATSATKGILQLAGDLGGTADAPTVPGLADKADTDHDHAISDVTGLQSALDGKQASGSYAAASHNHDGAYAPALGADDNYITDAEKAALHSHANKAALDAVSGVNTGDQTLPTWSTLSGKPVVVAAGADAAAARAAIGAGTSSLVIGTTADTAKSGDYEPDLSELLTTAAAPELIRDTMGTALVAGANITITPDDAGDTITIAATGADGAVNVQLVNSFDDVTNPVYGTLYVQVN